MFYAGQRGRTIAGELFRDGEAPRGFGSSFGDILKFAFALKNMAKTIKTHRGRDMVKMGVNSVAELERASLAAAADQ
jgi:hypothetical protein